MTQTLLKPELASIDVNDIRIDFSYQRQPAEKLIKRIAAHFDEIAAGHVLVNMREDGEIYLVDGNHRFQAMKRLGKTSIKCQIVYGLTLIEEAKEFRDRNTNVKGTSALERFHASLIMGDPQAHAIQNIVQRYGLFIPRNSGKYEGGIRAVLALEKIYKIGGENLLTAVLDLILQIWPGNTAAVGEKILSGTDLFIRKQKKYDKKRLIYVLKRQDPVLIGTRAETMRDLAGGKSIPMYIYEEFINLYNANLPVDKRLVQ